MKKLTDKQKLKKAIKTLKLYANLDLWGFCQCEIIPAYTSLEVRDKDGKIHDGWEYAEKTLKEIE